MKRYVRSDEIQESTPKSFNFIKDPSVHKGYILEGTDIRIIQEDILTQTSNVGFATLERYKRIPMWVVKYDDTANRRSYRQPCKYLKDAKDWAIRYYERFYGND